MSNRKLIEAMKLSVGLFNKDIVVLVVCNVDSVDLQEQTCDVTPVSGVAPTSIPSVSLKADPTDGILIVPKLNSTVVVAISTRNTAFVTLFSDIDSIETTIYNGTQKTSFKMSQGLAQFNDGSFDGIVKVNDLVTKLNAVENLLNDLITKYNAHTHVLTLTAGTGTAAPTVSLETGTINPITTKADLENSLVKHGK